MTTPALVPDATARFTGRVDDYVRARPGYPEAIFDDLLAAGALRLGAVVADIGSGTGISSEPFLRRGFELFGVEPNAAMRAAAEGALARYPRFRSQPGAAEATGLAPRSIDLVVAAQAFHWFDGAHARDEFARILTAGGQVALIWNSRRSTGSPFLAAYEELLLEFGTDYTQVGHRGVAAMLERLAEIFDAHAEDGRVRILYDTEVHAGRLAPG